MIEQAATALLLLVLVVAVWTDSRSRRIPNWLTFGGAAVGLLLAGLGAGLAGLGSAAAGWATGLLLMLPLHLLRVTGAGDVKLMAAVGAFLGPSTVVDAVLFTLVAGGLTGMMALLWHDGVRETLTRWGFATKHFLRAGVWLGARPRQPDEAPLRAPYAVAIAAGSLVALVFPLLGHGGVIAG